MLVTSKDRHDDERSQHYWATAVTRTPTILYVGTTWAGSNAASLGKAFTRLGLDCITIDSTPVSNSRRVQDRVRRRLTKERYGRLAAKAITDLILTTARAVKPDVFFVSKGLFLSPEVLAAIPAAVKIHYHPDDVMNPAEVSKEYLEGLSAWDLHVTTRPVNVTELLDRGARDVLRTYFAYDRDIHRPVTPATVASHTLAFVGTRRPDRTELIAALAERYGRAFLLCGDKWSRSAELRRNATLLPAQYGLGMSIVMSQTQICLGLLNSDNRDQHTYRSFEIPATGTLLLAERTDEHIELFGDDGQRAVLFSSLEELCSEADRLLADDALSRRIAQAGYDAITTGHHTYEDRAREILKYVGIHA